MDTIVPDRIVSEAEPGENVETNLFFFCIHLFQHVSGHRVKNDGVAQLVERQTQDPKTRRFEPRQEQKKNLSECARVKTCCADSPSV